MAGSPSYASLASGRPSCAGRLPERPAEQVEQPDTGLDESRAERGQLRGPRRDRRPVAELERGVPLCESGGVVGGQLRPGGQQACQRAVEVRASRGRAGLDDRQPVRREDERRRLAAQLLRRAEARAVQLGPFPLGRRQPDARSRTGVCPRRPSSRIRAAVSPKRISSASDRVRGEKPWVPTCSDSSRFVLPAPFGPTASTSPGSSASSSRAYERKFARKTDSTISRRGGSA